MVYNKTEKWYTKKLKSIIDRLEMFDWQQQIIIGTVLGGSSLTKPPKGKNYYLSMRSSDEMWLRYKVAELTDYYTSDPLQKYGKTWRANSPCSKKLSILHNQLYEEDNRGLNMNILDSFMDIGLAVWYLDGGGRTGRGKKNAYLNATKFGSEGAELVANYFNSMEMQCSLYKGPTRLRILFSVSGTYEFFKIIAHRFPPFLCHKLEGIGEDTLAAVA